MDDWSGFLSGLTEAQVKHLNPQNPAQTRIDSKGNSYMRGRRICYGYLSRENNFTSPPKTLLSTVYLSINTRYNGEHANSVTNSVHRRFQVFNHGRQIRGDLPFQR
jgi:hypothetical protein